MASSFDNFPKSFDLAYLFNLSSPGTMLAPSNDSIMLQPGAGTTWRFYYPDVSNFDIADIELRYTVMRKYAEHPDKVMAMLMQNGTKHEEVGFFSNGQISISMRSQMHNGIQLAAGAWLDYGISVYGNDIVSLLAYRFNKSYKAALHQLADAFGKKEFFGKAEKEPNWHVQERNSIAIDSILYIDRFYENFNTQASYYRYSNSHNRVIGFTTKFRICNGDPVDVFYTIWRRKSDEKEKLLPLFPEKPYMIYNQHLIKEDVSGVLFAENEQIADSCQQQQEVQRQYSTIYSACPGGLKNLPEADFSQLSGRTTYVPLMEDTKNFEYIDNLAERCKAVGSSLHISFPSNQGWVDATLVLSQPNDFGLQAPAIDLRGHLSGFADAGEALPNADRTVKVLVDPIIETGTITWLFASEKVGKTLVGLSIAYAASKGHRPIGAWKVESPSRVLYIDGEMPGHRLTIIIDKIMKGYGDSDGPQNRPFALYSFFENDLEYDSILDEDWQNQWNPRIARYDLVILDNYYSLNENRINIKPFLSWLKTHSKSGVAFLILDHTNSDGELQGSASKKRAADLGISLQRGAENEINIEYQFDRHGVKEKASPHTLIPCFTTSEFGFTLSDKTTNEPKKLNDMLSLYAYLLTLQDKNKKSVAEIVSYTGLGKSTVYNYLNAFRPEKDLSDAQKKSIPKITEEDKALVCKEKDRLMQLTNDELDQRLDYFQHSDLSSRFQR